MKRTMDHGMAIHQHQERGAWVSEHGQGLALGGGHGGTSAVVWDGGAWSAALYTRVGRPSAWQHSSSQGPPMLQCS